MSYSTLFLNSHTTCSNCTTPSHKAGHVLYISDSKKSSIKQKASNIDSAEIYFYTIYRHMHNILSYARTPCHESVQRQEGNAFLFLVSATDDSESWTL